MAGHKTAHHMAIPPIGMGTFGSDRYAPETVSAAVEEAIQCGYRLFDCASVYGNESQVGQVLARSMARGLVRREDLFIISKVWNDMHGQGDVLLSCAQSLKDLRLDTLDLYLVHWPFPNFHPPGCDGDARQPDAKPFIRERFLETWRQMERLADMGLVRHIGMSNMTVKKLEAVLPHCLIRPAAIEMELHPSFQQPALLEYCLSHGIQPIGYCPLGSPSRPERDQTAGDAADMQMPEITAIAQKYGLSPAQVCLKWAVQRGVVPIPFSVKTKNLRDNLAVVGARPFAQEDMAVIAGADQNCRLIKGQVFLWEGAKSWREIWDEEA